MLAPDLSREEVMYALELGINDILLKPFSYDQILPKIESVYGRFHDPKNPERIYEFAKQCLRDHDYEKALNIYEDLEELNRRNARPLVGKAQVFFKQNKLNEASQALEKAIGLNKLYVHAYSLKAYVEIARGDISKAIPLLNKAIDLSPLNIMRYEEAFNVLFEKSMHKECVDIFLKAIQADFRHHFIIEKLGKSYFNLKDYKNAQKYLSEATRLEPDNVGYKNALAICYRDAGDYEKAIQTYNKILKIDNNNYKVMFNKALIYFFMKKDEEGAKYLRKTLKINPSFKKAKDKLEEYGYDLES